MKSNNVVEINGKLYDARTGLPVHKSEKTVQKKVTVQKSVDGFSRNNSVKAHQKTTTTQHTPAHTTHPTVARNESASAKRGVSKSLTLNRSAVKHPHVTPSHKPSETPVQESVSSSAIKHADTARMQRAKQVAKSSSIAKFNHSGAVISASDPITPQAATLTEHLAKTNLQPPTTSHAVAATDSHKEKLIKHAVANADHHSKATKKHAKKPLGKLAASGLVALLLAGYVAYLNIPSISMKVAANRAGFAATMPGYKPAGYSLSGPIAYSPGQVTVNFQANTDDRKFSLKQQPTTWDSTALLENFVAKKTPNYLTYQDRGLTIYIYDGNSATWVNGGKLYNLEGNNSQLDTDQLLKLATSV